MPLRILPQQQFLILGTLIPLALRFPGLGPENRVCLPGALAQSFDWRIRHGSEVRKGLHLTFIERTLEEI